MYLIHLSEVIIHLGDLSKLGILVVIEVYLLLLESVPPSPPRRRIQCQLSPRLALAIQVFVLD